MISGKEAQKMGLAPVNFLKELPGLNNYKKFALSPIEDTPFFYYLQSLEEEKIGLILADPFLIFPDYSVELAPSDEKELGVQREEDLLVFTTVTLVEKNKMTTNLAAPIIINAAKGVAKQIIISERIEQMRTPLPLPAQKNDND